MWIALFVIDKGLSRYSDCSFLHLSFFFSSSLCRLKGLLIWWLTFSSNGFVLLELKSSHLPLYATGTIVTNILGKRLACIIFILRLCDFSYALRGHRKFRQGVRGGEECCPGSECFVDIDLLVFYGGEKEIHALKPIAYTVSEAGNHWPAYQGNTI